MAKKKRRRRLKKSVRRGCAIILALPILFCLGYCSLRLYRFFARPVPSATSDPIRAARDSASLADLAQRIDNLMHQPLRIDTATIALEVFDLQSGTTVYSRHADRLVAPASCMKLLTATAALNLLGTSHSYVCQVIGRGEQTGSVFQGDIVLQLDDDPMLESLDPLVAAIRQHGIQRIEGNIVLDLMRCDTLRAHPTAAVWDIPFNRLPVLLKGRQRVEADLRFLLASQGITWKGDGFAEADHRKGDDRPATLIYRHETPLTDVLAPMLIHSSNIKADALCSHIESVANQQFGLNLSGSRWLLGQAQMIVRQMGGSADGFVVNDGSGLSPDNRLTAHFLVQLLRYAWEKPGMWPVLIDEALATPGHPVRHGSLLGRMSAPAFRNKVFVKTGTLTTRALSSLAGYVQTSDERWLIFAVVNEDSPVMESRIFQDALCRELVR